MKCSRCGSELKETDTICLNCGNIIEPSNHDNFEFENFDEELEGLLDSYKTDQEFTVKDGFDSIVPEIENYDGPDYSGFNVFNQNKQSPKFASIPEEETQTIDANDVANVVSATNDVKTEPVVENTNVETVMEPKNNDPLYIENTSTFNPISMDDTGVFEPIEVDNTTTVVQEEPVVETPTITNSSYEEGIPEVVSSPKSVESEQYNSAYYEDTKKKEKKSFFKKKEKPKKEEQEEYLDTYNSDVVFDDGNADKKSILDIIPFKTIFIIAAIILVVIIGILIYRIVTTKPKSTEFESHEKEETEEKSKYSLTQNPNYILDKTWVCGGARSDGSLGNDYSTYFQYDFYKNGSYATKSVQRDDDYEDGSYSVSLEEISDDGYLYKVTLIANLNGGYKTKYFFTLKTNKEGTKATYKINSSTYACEEMDYFNNK